MPESQIDRLRRDLRAGRFANEAAVSQGLVLPILQLVGWPVFDTRVVAPEYQLEGRRVDFALCDPGERPKVFVEVKRVGQAEGGDRQLFEYAFHRGVPLAVLTDGQEWSFYLPAEEGRYEERRVYKLDLLEREAAECLGRLRRYLDYASVISGEALEAARSDLRDAARSRHIREALPRAWKAILEQQDVALVELLADKVEDLCGYRPEPEACSSFIAALVAGSIGARRIPNEENGLPVAAKAVSTSLSKTPRSGPSLIFQGKTYNERTALAVTLKLMQLLAMRDPTFLERFDARKHGTKRRYIATDRSLLYPGRPDLCDGRAEEIVPGWWLGTNYSRQRFEIIIRLACEVAGLSFGSDVQVDLG